MGLHCGQRYVLPHLPDDDIRGCCSWSNITPDARTVHVFLKLMSIPTVCSQLIRLSNLRIECSPVVIFISVIIIIDSCCQAPKGILCNIWILHALCSLSILCQLCCMDLEQLRNTELWPLFSGFVQRLLYLCGSISPASTVFRSILNAVHLLSDIQ